MIFGCRHYCEPWNYRGSIGASTHERELMGIWLRIAGLAPQQKRAYTVSTFPLYIRRKF
jgi:hypothetical protein